MTPKEAAKVIGCRHPRHVRYLIAVGKLRATIIPGRVGNRVSYDIPQAEAERYRDYKPAKGYPRGHERDPETGAKR